MTAESNPMPDGQGFVLLRNAPTRQGKVVVVENWAVELKQSPADRRRP